MKDVQVDYEIALVYDDQGQLTKVWFDGEYQVDKNMQIVLLKRGDGEQIDGELAKDIVRVCPVMKKYFEFCELREGHYLVHVRYCSENSSFIYDLIKEPGTYVWWKNCFKTHILDFDCDHPEISLMGEGIEFRDYLKKQNCICDATIQPEDTDIILHYYNNELLEVIQKPGTYVFCNHKGQHSLFPVKTWDVCLSSQADQPMLADYIKSIELQSNQILMVKKGLSGEVRLFDQAGKYNFWNLPGDDMSFEVIDCNQLIVPLEDREKLEIIRGTFGKYHENKKLSVYQKAEFNEKVEIMPAHWEEYRWRYLIGDGKIIRQFSAEDNIVWLWKNQVQAQGVRFRMIPHLQQKLKMAGQTVYTKDKTSVKVTCVIPYIIADPDVFIQKSPQLFYQMNCIGSITGILENDMHLTIQMSMRQIIQNYTIEELIEKREEIQTRLFDELKPLGDQYGLTILNAHLRDIIVGRELQEILNQVVLAEKKTQIKAIERRDEVAANRSLINTSKLLQDHPGAFALRKLQTVETICDKIQTLHLDLGDSTDSH